MKKLIENFQDDQDVASARKLVNYINKHRMAMTWATAEDAEIIQRARAVLENY